MRNVTFSHNHNLTLTSADVTYILSGTVSGIVAMLASVIVPTLLLKYRDIRSKGRRFLACVCIANFVLALGGIFQAATYHASAGVLQSRGFLCQIASAVWTYGDISSTLWTAGLAAYLLLALTCRKVKVANYLFCPLQVLLWGIPAAVVVSAWVSDAFGYDETWLIDHKHPTWCWIGPQAANKWEWYLVTSEGWAMASYGFLVVAFIVISSSIWCGKLNRVQSEEEINVVVAMVTDRNLRYVLLIFLAFRAWGSFVFVTSHNQASNVRSSASDFLIIMRGLTQNMQGVANTILFCLISNKIRNMIRRKLSALCCCCSRSPPALHLDSLEAPRIVRRHPIRKKSSDIDLSGISLDLPDPEDVCSWEDEVLFDKNYRTGESEI